MSCHVMSCHVVSCVLYASGHRSQRCGEVEGPLSPHVCRGLVCVVSYVFGDSWKLK